MSKTLAEIYTEKINPSPLEAVGRSVLANAQSALATGSPADIDIPLEEKVRKLEETLSGSLLLGAFSAFCGTGYGIPEFKAYLESWLKRAGDPSDPVERVLLEEV